MWLLGAGASASAGLPTAGQMIWQFKQRLYCAYERVHVKTCPDLGDRGFQRRLDDYFSQKGGYPTAGSSDEYSFFFEQTYPSDQDRRLFIDRMVGDGTPSQGHLALGILAKLGLLKTIWTTNFDRLPEDAFAKVFGSTSSFSVATLDNPQAAEQALSEARRPLIVKLHGDFQSRRLKNAKDELKEQDARLRRSLLNECQRQGLAVVGFSGRDDSVMEMLENAVQGEHSYPNGLFWFHRPDGNPPDRVRQLIEKARATGIDAHLIESETFDELVSDTLLLLENVPPEVSAILDERRTRLVPVAVPAPAGRDAFPFIRMNAVPLSRIPSTCRLVECKAGSTSEIRKAIEDSGVDVVAMKRLKSIICFGSDADVTKAFERFEIAKLDLYSIAPQRLTFDSAELGLITEALAKSLARERPVVALSGRDSWRLRVDFVRANEPVLSTLEAAAGLLHGVVPKSTIRWAESVRIRIERKLERDWLIFEPCTWIDIPPKPEADDPDALARWEDELEPAREFERERAATRINNQLHRLLDGWAAIFVGGSLSEATVRALGIGDGIDASFTISPTTAFSGRGGR